MGRRGSALVAIPFLVLAACSPAGEDGSVAAESGEHASEMVAAALGDTPPSLSSRGEIVVVDEQTRVAGAYSADCLITATSIAGVSRPATLGAFAAAFPAGTSLVFEPLHMVDFGSLCLVVDGRERICTLFYEADVDGWSPQAEALGLYTRDPACATAGGVGPGSAVADAVDAFGPVRFSFNYDNEGREYAEFDGAPESLSFRVSSGLGDAAAGDTADQSTLWPNGDFGGDYRDAAAEFTTSVAMPDAVISEVSVY